MTSHRCHDLLMRESQLAAIARALGKPSSEVRDCLEYHLEIGGITEMPVSDWPPTAHDVQIAFLRSYKKSLRKSNSSLASESSS